MKPLSKFNHEALYQVLFESANDAIVIMDDRLFIKCNQMALKIYGCNREDIIGHSPWEFSPDIQPDGLESRIIAQDHIQLALKGTPQRFYWRHRKKDGSEIDTTVTLNRIDWGGDTRIQSIVKDITERKKNEKALRESEELFRNLVENMPVGVYKSTAEGRFVEVNPALVKMLGFESREELLAVDIKNQVYFEPADRVRIIADHKEKELVVVRVKKKNGAEIWVEDFRWFYHDDKGNILYHEGLVHDITAQIKAEWALKKTEQEFKNLFEMANDSILIFRPDDEVILEANTKACLTYGFPKEELIGMSLKKLTKDVQREERTIKQILEQKTLESYESVHFNKAGIPIEFLINFSLINYREEQMILSIERDITEWKNIQQKLMESEEKFRSLAEYSPNMIFINIKGKIVYANSLCESVMGYTKEELYLPDFDFMELINPENHTQIREAFRHHLKGEEVPPYEYAIRTKQGKKLHTVLSTKLIRYGDESAILGVVTDITDRKTVELMLIKQAEELKDLNATKDKFFSIIAHDLKNPFNTILGFIGVLKNEYQELDDTEIQKYINTISISAERAYNLLENLLLWARTQTGTIEFLPEVFNLQNNLWDTIQLLEDMAKKKSISITYTIPDHCFVFADKNMIDTIIRNLLSNAIKFTPKDGNIHISVVVRNDLMEISVKDSGVGIPSVTIDSIFKMDQKISTLGTEKEKGSGLGLLLCKEFVERHGGKIWVKSKSGKGSVFTFTIPVGK
ncbi:MAG: PAS domain-containing sensor histidine kinase [Bacteroidales bacterium]|nr:PAS domain-containing sensor histidine kinase [Bacteroidales bacterium]